MLEPAKDALFLLFVGGEALQFGDEVGDHVAHFVQILGLDVFQRRVGELGDALLGVGAVGKHQIGVGDVDLLGELVDLRLLLGGEHWLLNGLGRGGRRVGGSAPRRGWGSG